MEMKNWNEIYFLKFLYIYKSTVEMNPWPTFLDFISSIHAIQELSIKLFLIYFVDIQSMVGVF